MIKLTKNNIIWSSNYIEKGHEDHEEETVCSFIPYLSNILELEEGLTFQDIFNFIEEDKDIIERIFTSNMGHCPLQYFIDEIKKDGIKDDDEEIEYLEIGWFAVVGEDIENRKEITLEPEIHGIGKGSKASTDLAIDVSLTPLNDLKKFVVKLNNKVELWNQTSLKKDLEGYRQITVHDLLCGILEELTFYGPPKDRDKAFEEMCKEDGPTTSWEELNDSYWSHQP